MSIQKQFHDTYNTDRQLRGCILTAVGVPLNRDRLSHREKRTAHQLIASVAKRLR